MTPVVAVAHPNIALIKYWGKRDVALNLPAVSSISLTLSEFETRTTLSRSAADIVKLNGTKAPEAFSTRALHLIALMTGENRPPICLDTTNTFPTGAGLASSASGFAALTIAVDAAFELNLSLNQLTDFARRGSGSACRSLLDGFVHWHVGEGTQSPVVQLAPRDHWDVAMVVAIVTKKSKAVSSTAGMLRTQATSPLWKSWVETSEDDIEQAKAAIAERNLTSLGEAMERSTFKMHATMQTSQPPLLYWQPATVAVLQRVMELRRAGLSAYTTMDAGPQVKVLCMAADAPKVAAALESLVEETHILTPGSGPRVTRAPI